MASGIVTPVGVWCSPRRPAVNYVVSELREEWPLIVVCIFLVQDGVFLYRQRVGTMREHLVAAVTAATK